MSITDATAKEREQGVVAAYLAGRKVSEIEREFHIGRSTLYHILKRTGNLPARARRSIDASTHDATLAGLHELITHQDHRLAELEAENRELRVLLGDYERQMRHG